VQERGREVREQELSDAPAKYPSAEDRGSGGALSAISGHAARLRPMVQPRPVPWQQLLTPPPGRLALASVATASSAISVTNSSADVPDPDIRRTQGRIALTAGSPRTPENYVKPLWLRLRRTQVCDESRP
jgi:hypothetical protein